MAQEIQVVDEGLFGGEFLTPVEEARYGCFGCGDLHFQGPGTIAWRKEIE